MQAGNAAPKLPARPTTRRICWSSTTTGASATCCRAFCTREGYRVTTADNAAEARAKLEGLHFDLLILDVMMPGESGFDLAKSLRQSSGVPILMLTARDETEMRIAGPGDRRRRLRRQAVRAARTLAAHRQHPQARAAGHAGAGGIDPVRRFRVPDQPRRIAARRGHRAPDRPRARNAGACWRHEPGRNRAAAGARRQRPGRRTSARSTCRSTGCAARSSATRPIR